MNAKKTALSLAVLLALGATTAQAITTTGNNFTMLSGAGTLSGGTNDITFTWDGTYRTAVVTDGTSNASLSSPTPIVTEPLILHHMNIYGPGTYTFNTGCPAGNPSCATPFPGAELYELTVPAGYLGAHLLWDWSTSQNEDVLLLWKLNSSWDASGGELGNGGVSSDPFCEAPFTNGFCNTNPNPNGNTRYTVWDAVSVDAPAATIRSSNGSILTGTVQPNEDNLYHGIRTVDGPITGFALNFNLQGLTAPVPLPPAVWLFGSGFVGLLAVVRRKRRS